MKIGDLAKSAGVNIQTIRFYEREGVMRAPSRTASGYRAYTDRDLQHVMFVKQCQQLGFTLAEIKQLATLHESLAATRNLDAAALARFAAMAGERLQIIDSKILALQEMRRNLELLLRQAGSSADQCPGRKTGSR
jgi:MerR family copper efflux transcriptional regulator